MAPNPLTRSTSNPLNLITLIVIAGVLYFTRDICIPFVLAILLSFVLSPVVSRLQRWRVPRVPAVFLVMTLMLTILGMCGWLVGGQLVSLAERLPQYQANVHEKFKSFHTSQGGLVDRLNATLDSYSKEIESIGSDAPAPLGAVAPAADTAPTTAPITVAVVKTQVSKVAAIEKMMLGVVSPMTTFGIIIILSLFLLIRQEDVRDRVIRLLGGGQLQVATQALDDAGARVSRYLLIQLIVNASFGVCIAVGLYFLGVPFSPLWGLLAAGLRFVPYFGAPIAAVAPLLLAFAATPGWSAVIFTFVLFAALELAIANFVEPWLYGSSARISPLAIVASAIFWSWLWGPVGLLLSMPLTVCLVVIGRHVPRLWYLSVILGDEPVLAPEARFYQRLLAGDQPEAWDLAEAKLRDSSLVDLYDGMIIPALILAEEDRHRDELDPTHAKLVFEGVRELLEELSVRPMVAPELVVPEGTAAVTARVTVGVETGVSETPAVAVAPVQAGLKVLCLPANDEADEMGALMLAQLLGQRGLKAEVISCKALAGERLEAVEKLDAGLVCVSAVPPRGVPQARYLCKRLRARFPGLKIVAGLWREPEGGTVPERLPAALADGVATSLAAAVVQLAALANHETYRTDAVAEARVAAPVFRETASDVGDRIVKRVTNVLFKTPNQGIVK